MFSSLLQKRTASIKNEDILVEGTLKSGFIETNVKEIRVKTI